MTENVEKYIWCDLIKFFEQNHYITNGLTIPFLIGAIELLQKRKMTISKLIEEFTDSKSCSRTTIMKCENIGEFVIGIMDFESEDYYKKFPNSLPNEFNNLAVTDNSLNEYGKVSELITLFENRYNDEIRTKNYSKNAGKWSEFTAIDLLRIENFNNVAANKSYI
jgi:hypothetical protein